MAKDAHVKSVNYTDLVSFAHSYVPFVILNVCTAPFAAIFII